MDFHLDAGVIRFKRGGGFFDEKLGDLPGFARNAEHLLLGLLRIGTGIVRGGGIRSAFGRLSRFGRCRRAADYGKRHQQRQYEA